jgi:hypothetical protein
MKPDAAPFLSMARECLNNPATVAAVLEHIEDPQEKRRYVATLRTDTIIEACRILGYLSDEETDRAA